MDNLWKSGTDYERYMGRWSRLIAEKFLKWLDIPPSRLWLDAGCGTGSLTGLILANHQPKKIYAVDSSGGFISYAQKMIANHSVHFMTGLAQALPLDSDSVDAAVSGLVLNFVPRPEDAVREMMRVTKPGGTIGIFLWDYSEGMQMLRYFWDAAAELDEKAASLDEGLLFPLCRKGKLEALALESGLAQVEAIPVEVETGFKDFNDYWEPFFGGAGPAPGYVMSLSENGRQELEDKLRHTLPISPNGSIRLTARAWAVKGKRQVTFR